MEIAFELVSMAKSVSPTPGEGVPWRHPDQLLTHAVTAGLGRVELRHRVGEDVALAGGFLHRSLQLALWRHHRQQNDLGEVPRYLPHLRRLRVAESGPVTPGGVPNGVPNPGRPGSDRDQ